MKIWRKISIGMGILIVIFVWIFVIGLSSHRPGSFFNNGHNAVWLGHEWVDENKSLREIQGLVDQLKSAEIDTVFVHTGPILEDGTIDPETYKYAINFIERAKKIEPKINYQAWLGQIRGKIDLGDENVRHNIAKQCLILSDLIGFDGIHFDIEPVWDEDEEFIELLKESREVLKDKKISVALAEFIPGSLIWFTEKIHTFENVNSEVNYENVAQYADQVVVMVYDTGLSKEWVYRWLVKEQTIWVTNLLDKEVFIGIPAYEEVKEGFNPDVENMENGLRGIVSGLNNMRSDEEVFAGVAIYPYWEIESDEWKIYEDLWLK